MAFACKICLALAIVGASSERFSEAARHMYLEDASLRAAASAANLVDGTSESNAKTPVTHLQTAGPRDGPESVVEHLILHSGEMTLTKDKVQVEGVVILTEDLIFAFPRRCGLEHDARSSGDGGRFPGSLCDPLGEQYEAMATGTLEMLRKADENDEDSITCASLSGCSSESCKGGRISWRVCATLKDIRVWQQNIDEAFLQRNNIRERLGLSIATALESARSTTFDTHASAAPASFSPFVLEESHIGSQTDVLLDTMVEAFRQGTIQFNAGKNSRSGASFFFSQDRAFLAKRIRDWEYEAFWDSIQDGEYKRHLETQTSLLNPIYLAFVSHGHWIVMRTEKLTPTVEAELPPKTLRESIFMDIKPAPLTSDRKKLSRLLLRTRASSMNSFQLQALEGWDTITQKLDADYALLENHKLVDYSVLLHGAFFEQPKSAKDQWLATMANTVTPESGCVYGCPDAKTGNDRSLFDATNLVVRHGVNPVPLLGATYICCCMELSTGDSATVRSPCAMVKTNLAPGESFMYGPQEQGCQKTMQKITGFGKWHAYHQAQDLPVTNGRCMLGLGVFEKEVIMKGTAPAIIGPELAFGVVTEHTPVTCGVVCVSIMDYLLPLNTYNSVENVALIVVYGTFKWSDYQKRLKNLLQCLAVEELPQPHEKQAGRSATAAIYRKFIDVPAPTITSCRDEQKEAVAMFIEQWPSLDQKVLNGLEVSEYSLDENIVGSPDDGVCRPEDGTFSDKCVVSPVPRQRGGEWRNQLQQMQCKGGDTFVLRLRPKDHPDVFVGIRLLSTDNILTGSFQVFSEGGDYVDDDWMQFAANFNIKMDSRGDVTLGMSRDSGPVNLVLEGGGERRVLGRMVEMNIWFDPEDGKVHFRQSVEYTKETTKFLFLFDMPKYVDHPDVTGSLAPIPAESLQDCQVKKAPKHVWNELYWERQAFKDKHEK